MATYNEKTEQFEGQNSFWKNLGTALSKRAKIVSAESRVSLSKQQRLQLTANQLKKDVDDLIAWKIKAEQLLSEKAMIETKYPVRTGLGKFMRGAGKAVAIRGIGRSLIPFASVYPIISQAMSFAQDPTSMMYELQTGQSLAPKGMKTKEGLELRDIQMGKIL